MSDADFMQLQVRYRAVRLLASGSKAEVDYELAEDDFLLQQRWLAATTGSYGHNSGKRSEVKPLTTKGAEALLEDVENTPRRLEILGCKYRCLQLLLC